MAALKLYGKGYSVGIHDLTPIQISAGQTVNQQFRSGNIAGEGDRMLITQTHDIHDFCVEQIIHGGIEKEDHVNLIVADSLTDLLNSAQLMGQELVDLQSGGIGDHLSSGVGSADSMLGQDAAIRSTELNH